MLCARSLDFELLGRVLQGGQAICDEAGVSVIGGHSIDDTEPKFGLAVTGIVHPDRVVSTHGAPAGTAALVSVFEGLAPYKVEIASGFIVLMLVGRWAQVAAVERFQADGSLIRTCHLPRTHLRMRSHRITAGLLACAATVACASRQTGTTGTATPPAQAQVPDQADTETLRDALIRAVERGVKVWLLVDGFGSYNCPADYFAELAKRGFTQSYNYFAWRNTRYELTDDVNGFRQEGFSRFDQTIRHGRRMSAADASRTTQRTPHAPPGVTRSLTCAISVGYTSAVPTPMSTVGETAIRSFSQRPLIAGAAAIASAAALTM